jgi:hypothetical protein
VLPSSSAIVLSDYAKGVLSESVCKAVIAEVRGLGIPVLVDPKSSTFEKYRNATTVCPNLNELAHAAQKPANELQPLLDVAERYVREFGFDFLTVTLSEKGIAVVSPALSRQVFDEAMSTDSSHAKQRERVAFTVSPAPETANWIPTSWECPARVWEPRTAHGDISDHRNSMRLRFASKAAAWI